MVQTASEALRSTPRVASQSEATRLACRSCYQHAAKDLPDLIAGEPLLPDDHRVPRPACCGGRFVGSHGGKVNLGEFARICRLRRSYDSFRGFRPYSHGFVCVPREMRG